MTSAMGSEIQGHHRQLTYGNSVISYDLRYTDRKSLEISVYPDGSVVIKAPMIAALDDVEAKIKKRARWICKQLRYFAQFEPRIPPRRFVGGESHLYLGRSYRLKITSSEKDRVSLKGRFFCISASDTSAEHIAGLLQGWYRNKATEHFARVFESCWISFEKHGGHRGDGLKSVPGSFNRCRTGFERHSVLKPTLRIARMKNRWGSLSRNATLTLNPELIKAPRECIEYVVIHELCHLLHHNHGPEFQRLLERSLPDWMKRKHKLEMALFRQA